MGDSGKRISEVDSWNLLAAFGDETTFVPFNASVWVELALEHPLDLDGAPAGRKWNEFPGVIVLDALELAFGGSTPLFGFVTRHIFVKRLRFRMSVEVVDGKVVKRSARIVCATHRARSTRRIPTEQR